MNTLYSLWFFYTILRDIGNKGDPIISIGFMRQTCFPWKTGRGIQFRMGKYIFQIGVCKSNKNIEKDTDGLLYAMQGRLLNDVPNEIGRW